MLEKEKLDYKQRFFSVGVGEHLQLVQTTDIAYFYSIEKKHI